MHGLINRALQNFVTDIHGAQTWTRVAALAGLDPPGFEAMLSYDDAMTGRVIAAASRVLERPSDDLLEDLGTYLVTHPRLDAIRRLMRFGGAGFADFLQALNELEARIRLALPELDPPGLSLRRETRNAYRLRCRWTHPWAAPVLIGLLRAMADDYGALVVLGHAGQEGEADVITIRVLDADFAAERTFALAGAGA